MNAILQITLFTGITLIAISIHYVLPVAAVIGEQYGKRKKRAEEKPT